MPHLKLRGSMRPDDVKQAITTDVQRWGRIVLKIETSWLRADGLALLVEGVVVEHSRPLHPVAIVGLDEFQTVIRLWPIVNVERTPATQRWLAWIAAKLQQEGAGPVDVTNIDSALFDGLGLQLGG